MLVVLAVLGDALVVLDVLVVLVVLTASTALIVSVAITVLGVHGVIIVEAVIVAAVNGSCKKCDYLRKRGSPDKRSCWGTFLKD
ncbi:hypothetical protein [Neobacillus niacini]|uniref:hypothetical protein n=1 Tax=Neobacillus niacini TaxID=86668 RepID=UPI001EE70795|nr:hypothetical protein [Neobacillus niacini]